MRRHSRMCGAIAVFLALLSVAAGVWIGVTSAPRASSTATEVVFAIHVTASVSLVGAGILLAVIGIRPMWVVLLALTALMLQAELIGNAPQSLLAARAGFTVLGLAGPALVLLLAAAVSDEPPATSGSGRGRTHETVRALAMAAAGVIVLLAVMITLFRVPLLDLSCRFDCALETWVAFPAPRAAAALETWYVAAVAVGAGLITVLLLTACRRVSVGARWAWTWLTVLAAALLVMVGEAVRTFLMYGRAPIDLAAFDALRLLAYGILGLAVLISGLVVAKHLLVVRELTRRIGHETEPGQLQDRLAAILDDESLSLGFWIPETAAFVDRDGETMEPAGGATHIRISRRGRTLAVIATSRRADEVRASVRSIGATARLAIDNERRLAETAFRTRETAKTRREIVDRSSTQRHAIERGLHDGAQAGLVAAIFELARLRAADGGSAEADRLERALIRAHARTRELAHGVYPALLDGVGLTEALRELAMSRPLSVIGGDERAPTPVEHALYRLVRAAGDDGTPLNIEIVVDGEARVVVSGVQSSPPAVIADEIAVLGGHIERDGDTITAVVPCVQ